jgi:hypothetical protein
MSREKFINNLQLNLLTMAMKCDIIAKHPIGQEKNLGEKVVRILKIEQ